MSVTQLKVATAAEPTITLRQRIVDALTKPTTPAEVRSCIAHTQADLARVERERARAAEKAVDPLATEDEANEGKRDHDALRFDVERLNSSLAHLDQRLAAVTREEDQSARRVQYQAAVKARDEAETALRDVYPRAVAEIVGTLRRLRQAEALVLSANRNKPDGAEHIMAAETKANDGALANGANDLWPIGEGVRLPARFGSLGWHKGIAD